MNTRWLLGAGAACGVLAVWTVVELGAFAPPPIEYRVLATTKTSTMEKELNTAAAAGFRFQAVMGGETALGGNEVVSIMARTPGASGARYQYRLLATNRTSTMQSELQAAADAGFDYRGQTVSVSTFGGREVVCIMEKDLQHPATGYEYRLLATSKTSTLEKELQPLGQEGFEALGMTVGKTAFGGAELVTITRRRR
jgi:hypothetical protein